MQQLALLPPTDGPDRLEGNGRANVINSLGGDDTVFGRGGDDQLNGGDGNDDLYGGAGEEFLFGGLGDDLLHAGSGDDRIALSQGSDTALGGAGADEIDIYGSLQGVFQLQVDGGAGRDHVSVFTAANGTITGGAGQDLFRVFPVQGGSLTGPILLTPDRLTYNGGVLQLTDFETYLVNDTEGNDSITTGDGRDEVRLSSGEDEVALGGGNDLLSCIGGEGRLLDGGTGRDMLVVGFTPGDAGLIFTVDAGTATDNHGSVITGFERYELGGTEGADVLTLGAGRDFASGQGDDDLIAGGGGDDVIAGVDGRDTLSGQGGRDIIYGGTGGDRIDGGAGDDVISCGGRDLVRGGAGADIFELRLGTAAATVFDFAAGEDVLQILRFGLDGLPLDGPLDPALFSTDAPAGDGGQFIYTGGTLFWDADGAGAGVGLALVRLENEAALTAADIRIGFL